MDVLTRIAIYFEVPVMAVTIIDTELEASFVNVDVCIDGDDCVHHVQLHDYEVNGLAYEWESIGEVRP